MRKLLLHSERQLIILLSILLISPMSTYAQSLSFGVFTDNNKSVFDITSLEVVSKDNGELVNNDIYSNEDLNQLNKYHTYNRKFNILGFRCNYDFKKADSSRFTFGVGIGVGIGKYEHRRYANYDETIYHGWSGNQFIAKSDNTDWSYKLSTNTSYFFTPNISLKGVLSLNFHSMNTNDIENVLTKESEVYKLDETYKSNILYSSFELFLHYNIDGFNIFIGPRFYYNYQWVDYKLTRIDSDGGSEFSDLTSSTYVEQSAIKLSGGMYYTINNKVGIGIQLYGNKNSLSILGQINYYFNLKK